MPVIDDGGRPKSVRTPEEEERLLVEDFRRLSPEERAAVAEIVSKAAGGMADGLRRLAEVEYVRRPVDIETFLSDPYYLGETGSSLWPRLRQDMIELFEGDYHEAILGGCVGVGARVFGCDGSIRRLVEMSKDGPNELLSIRWETKSLEVASAGPATETGDRDVVLLVLRSGAYLVLTPDHEVCVQDAQGRWRWVAASQLKSGDEVVSAAFVPTRSSGATDDELIVLAAWCWCGQTSSGSERLEFCVPSSLLAVAIKAALDKLEVAAVPYDRPKSGVVLRVTKEGEPRLVELLRKFGVSSWSVPFSERVALASAHGWRAARHLVDQAYQMGAFVRVSGHEGDGLLLVMPDHESAQLMRLLLLQLAVRAQVVVGVHDAESDSDEDEPYSVHDEASWVRLGSALAEMEELDAAIAPDGSMDVVCLDESRCVVGYGVVISGASLVRFYDVLRGEPSRPEHDWMADPVELLASCSGKVRVGDATDSSVDSGYLANGILVHNSIGWGKTFFASCAMAYVLYQISCLRNPQAAYGIDPGSHLYVALLSVTEKVARRVAIGELVGKLERSRYFQENFRPRPAPSQLEIRFPGQVNVVAGSTTSTAVIGLNVFAGFIDEASFMVDRGPKPAAEVSMAIDTGEKIYNSILRRMKSRFQRVGRLPGILITVSSKERPAAFIERRIQQAKDSGDPQVFVREYAAWDVKPASFFSPKRFKVVVGDERVASRIIDDPDQERRYTELGLRIVEVPEDYRKDFERDVDAALRDIAGIATDAISPFIQRIEAVHEAMGQGVPNAVVDHAGEPLEQWVPTMPLNILWTRIAEQHVERLRTGHTEILWRPTRNPDAVRYAHIDPSLAGDSTGLAIAHIAQWVDVERRDANGERIMELAPVIEVDLLLRVVPPPGGEIMLADVRSVLYQFMEHGFNIRMVTMDQYQSADTLQQMRRRGVDAELLSVDRTTEPYEVLKAALYERRLRMPKHSYLFAELRHLQRTISTGRRIKIDHPKTMTAPDGSRVKGSKDLADALCGVVYSLSQRSPGKPLPMVAGVSVHPGRQPKPAVSQDAALTAGAMPILSGAESEESENHDWLFEGRRLQPDDDGSPNSRLSGYTPAPLRR